MRNEVNVKLGVALLGLAVLFFGTACQNGFMTLGEDEDGSGAADGNGSLDGLGSAPEGCTPDDRFFVREVWAPTVKNSCFACHNAQGAAADSDFVLRSEGWGGYLEENRQLMSDLARTKRDDTSVLLLKAMGTVAHGGGAVIQEGDDNFNRLKAFIDRAENPGSCEAANDDSFYRDVDFLESDTTLRKASLSLAGRLPTDEEMTMVQSGNLDGAVQSVMQDPVFKSRLKESFNDVLLTDIFLPGDNAIDLLDEDVFPNARWYGDNNDNRNRANDAIAQEPLEIISYIVTNDRPFTEILTADYTVVNPYSARSYGVLEDAGFADENDANEWRMVQLAGTPHAGVVTTPAFLNRNPTTDTNRNRNRSAVFYDYFLATDVLKLAERPIDPTQTDMSQNPTLFDSQCTVCHSVIDPVAGAFQNWDENGHYAPRDSGWYTDMLPPGLEDEIVGNSNAPESLSWLAQRTTADPRFTVSAVHHAYTLLTGDEPLTLPQDPTRGDYEASFRAYEVQYEFFKQLGKTFEDNNYSFQKLLVEIIKSPYYRAHNARSVSPKRQMELADLGTSRLLSPEMLHRKIQATTGATWRVNDRNVLLDTREFKLLYGGIDSNAIVKRLEEPNALASSIARRMANEVSCLSVSNDFGREQSERVMFPYVNQGDTHQSAEAAVRQNITHLHWQLLGEKVADGDPQMEATYTLFTDILEDGQRGRDAGEYGGNLPGMCQNNGVTNDDDYTVRAWMAVVTYLLSDYDYLYE